MAVVVLASASDFNTFSNHQQPLEGETGYPYPTKGYFFEIDENGKHRHSQRKTTLCEQYGRFCRSFENGFPHHSFIHLAISANKYVLQE